MSRDLYNELKAVAATSGLSTADILKIGMEKGKAAAKDAYRKGYLDCLAECLGVVEQCPNCYSEMCELIPDDV